MGSTSEQKIKDQVQDFYDRVGWQEAAEGIYQNARFEDLRPVSSEYIHRCHLRAGAFLAKSGRFLLDAGSGPIQYPEYLTYSAGYQKRVCLDISKVALTEARKRIGEHGLYVIADVAALPFSSGSFDGVISLHTLHHLPPSSQRNGYLEIWRVLTPGKSAVIVNGWTDAPLMKRLEFLVNWMEKLKKRRGRSAAPRHHLATQTGQKEEVQEPQNTFVQKFTPTMLREMLGLEINYEVRCWRSVSVRFLRAVIHPRLAGAMILKVLYWKEDHFAHWFGRVGQYPLIILRK